MAKHEKEKKETEDDTTWDDSEWDEDLEDEETEPETEEDEGPSSPEDKKPKFTKIKDLKEGMEEVNVEAEVDFIGETYGKGFGEAPYAIGFIKDSTGEIKMTFWADDVKKAKKGVKVRVMGAAVTTYKEQLQLSPNRKRGVDFI